MKNVILFIKSLFKKSPLPSIHTMDKFTPVPLSNVLEMVDDFLLPTDRDGDCNIIVPTQHEVNRAKSIISIIYSLGLGDIGFLTNEDVGGGIGVGVHKNQHFLYIHIQDISRVYLDDLEALRNMVDNTFVSIIYSGVGNENLAPINSSVLTGISPRALLMLLKRFV